MLGWLALALQSNSERGKMQMDPRKAANHSFFISLNAVLLKLCEPFLEPLSGKAWGKVDPRCASENLSLPQHPLMHGASAAHSVWQAEDKAKLVRLAAHAFMARALF